MREELASVGRSMLRHPAHWLAPVTAALLLATWIISEAGRGPWPELLWFVFPAAVMVGIAPWLPFASLAIMVLLPTAQVAGLIVGPSSNSWPIYFSALLVALALGAVADGRVRRYVLVTGVVAAALVAYLMAVPGPRGSWSEWLGRYGDRLHPHQEDFVMIALAGAGLYLAAWIVGVLYRLALQGKFPRLVTLLSDAQRVEEPVRPVHNTLSGLSPRELEIYALVARGLSNSEIASREHISEATVKTHVSSVLRKLELRSRTQLAAHAAGVRGQVQDSVVVR